MLPVDGNQPTEPCAFNASLPADLTVTSGHSLPAVQTSLLAGKAPDRVPLASESQEPVSLSPEVALFLIEIYFERHYQADLLFDKQRFLDDYVNHTVPKCVLLAVFALASL